MPDKIIHPKEGEWVLIVDKIRDAFDEGYIGTWNYEHHILVGQILRVASINAEHHTSYIVTCHLPDAGKVKQFIEFPYNCIERTGEKVPEGWLPVTIIPKTKPPFIGITKHGIPVLVEYNNGAWIHFYSRKTMVVIANIIAYQTIPNFPIKIEQESK